MQQLTYTQHGDYFFPNIILRDSLLNSEPLTKYGNMRLTYLKDHRPILYNSLILKEELYTHLLDVQRIAESKLETMISQLVERNPPPDKALDGLAWVAHMNMLKYIAEKSILNELIYK